MFVLRGFFLLIAFLTVYVANAQTSPSVVTVDSTLRNPDAKKNPIFDSKKDTTASLKVEGKAKPGVFKDSARLAIEKMPKQAVRRSATLPGWGQVKNNHWWKVPIIYGGFVGVGLIVDFNQRFYKQSLSELQYRDANEGLTRDKELASVDTRGLIQFKDFYRRNRDFGVLLGVGLYALNIIDAYVSAKFFRFDISDELGFKVKPAIISPVSNAYALVPALKIQLSL
ncbi:MAG: hypothetical protein H7Y07_04870 [Pyrinomonadaceae bacterium]|nr:hypothetical protein [Sphingobacteriaceae bacterium]